MQNAAAAVDPQMFRDVMGTYPTGVVVVTALDADQLPVALVMGTFTSVSLDPQLVGFLPMKSSRRFEAIDKSPAYTINILASDQLELCRAAASNNDPFARFPWSAGRNGMPVFENIIASIECTPFRTVDAGDHLFCMGAVEELRMHRQAPPLVFFQGEFGSYGRLRQENDVELMDAMLQVLPLHARVRTLGGQLQANVCVLSRAGREMATTLAFDPQGEEQREILGRRTPLIAPIGELFVAWDEQAGTEWITAAAPEIQPLLQDRLEAVRAAGWGVSLKTDYRVDQVDPALRTFQTHPYTPQGFKALEGILRRAGEYYAPTDLEDELLYDVAGLTVPLGRGDGAVHSVLRASEFPAPLSGRQIREAAATMASFAALAASGLQ